MTNTASGNITPQIRNERSLPYTPCELEFPVERNPFESLALDLTYRCNMRCNFCYNPERTWADMRLAYFEEICNRLPQKVTFKFTGGEPALHPQFFDFLKIAVQYGHKNFVATNGLILNDRRFMDRLSCFSIPLSIGLSFDGGYSGNDIYKYITGIDCLDSKLKAFNNLKEYKTGRVSLSAIIIRGLNERVISELLELADKHKDFVRHIHFRGAGRLGRWQDTKTYNITELKQLVGQHFSEKQFQPKCIGEIHCKPEEGRDCCYRFRPTSRLQISLIDFASPDSCRCLKRGKLVDRKFLVQSFFEQMIKNATRLKTKISSHA